MFGKEKAKAKTKSKRKAKVKAEPVPIEELAPARRTTQVPRFGGHVLVDIEGPTVQIFQVKGIAGDGRKVALDVRVSLRRISNRFVEVDEEWEVPEFQLRQKRTWMFRRTFSEGKAAVS